MKTLRRFVALTSCATAMLTCMVGHAQAAGPSQASQPTGQWEAVWQAPQSDGFLSVNAAYSTLREIATVHSAGQQLRVRLSNFYSKLPVKVGAASVAVSAGQAATRGIPVSLTFGGRKDLVLRPGESVYSDAAALPVNAMDRLAISLYVADPALSLSRHNTGNEVIWFAPGNATQQASGFGYTGIKNILQASIVLVDRVEVQSSGAQRSRVVATFGDSITDGFMGAVGGISLIPGNQSIGTDVRYPDFLQRRALTEGVSATFVSAAISGNRLLSGPTLPMFGPAGLGRFDRDVLSLPGLTDVIVLIGINDLGGSPQPMSTAGELIKGLKDVIQRVHAAGSRVSVGTLLPSRGAFGGLMHGSAAVDQARIKLNQWIRQAADIDQVIDFDQCMKDPQRPSHLRRDYDSGDGLHPNAKGYEAMAACVDLTHFK